MLKLELHAVTSQWRRALLFIGAALALASAITLQQSFDKNIFSVKVELNTEGLHELANKTETFVTSVAGEAASYATSVIDKAGDVIESGADEAGDAVESGWDALTEGVGDLFKRAPMPGPTPAPLGPSPHFIKLLRERPDLIKRAEEQDDEDEDDDYQHDFQLEIKPHTTVDIDFDDLPILGDILSFILNLVIMLTPLGLLFCLHVVLDVFLWIYFARLVFRLISASSTPTEDEKAGKASLLFKAAARLPCFAAPQAILQIVQVFFVPVVIGLCFGLGLALQWLDHKLWHVVSGNDYDSFMDLVTVDFSKGAAPGMVKAAFVLVCVAIALDLLESLISFSVNLRHAAVSVRSQRSDEKFDMMPPMQHNISWPTTAYKA